MKLVFIETMETRSIWKEPDPIGVVMKQTNMTRLQVLEGIRDALNRHPMALQKDPRAPKAMKNLNKLIEQERSK